MRISKLFKDSVHDLVASTGSLYAYHDRCSGKSTGYALSIIGEAMTNPGKRILILDKSMPCAKLCYIKMFVDLVMTLAYKLELEHFQVVRDEYHSQNFYLQYNIYTTI
jgi:hypothetical protein